MFLSNFSSNDSTKKDICQNLVAFMAMDGNIDNLEREQVVSIYNETFGSYELNNLALDMLSNINKDTVKKGLLEILNRYDFRNNSIKIKQFIFELLSCALCNNKYDDDEKEVVEYIASNFKIDFSILKEMEDIIDTILVINKRMNTVILEE